MKTKLRLWKTNLRPKETTKTKIKKNQNNRQTEQTKIMITNQHSKRQATPLKIQDAHHFKQVKLLIMVVHLLLSRLLFAGEGEGQFWPGGGDRHLTINRHYHHLNHHRHLTQSLPYLPEGLSDLKHIFNLDQSNGSKPRDHLADGLLPLKNCPIDVSSKSIDIALALMFAFQPLKLLIPMDRLAALETHSPCHRPRGTGVRVTGKFVKKKAPVQVGRGGTQTARLAEAETQDQADVGSAE